MTDLPETEEMVPEEMVPCPFCHGYGRDPYGRLCDICDGFASVPKVKPPQLVSMPLPKGWALLPLADIRRNSAIYHHAPLEMYSWDFELHGEARALARAKAGAMLALLDWFDHEAAVKAQDEVKPCE